MRRTATAVIHVMICLIQLTPYYKKYCVRCLVGHKMISMMQLPLRAMPNHPSSFHFELFEQTTMITGKKLSVLKCFHNEISVLKTKNTAITGKKKKSSEGKGVCGNLR